MSKEELFEKFKEMFPTWARTAGSYKKIGSRTLAINFAKEVVNGEVIYESRVFLYINDDNWQFGTKLWRKRPEKVEKKDVKE